MSEAGRLYWKCRRGSLELDLILLKFYKQCFPSLSADEQNNFEQLLDEQDPVLSAWIYGSAPTEPRFQQIIQLIKEQF